MPIEPGQQLLHYRLIEKIGEGGMGAVWKATDTTLDLRLLIQEPMPLNEGLMRAVRITLPPCLLNPDFPADPKRRRRAEGSGPRFEPWRTHQLQVTDQETFILASLDVLEERIVDSMSWRREIP